MARMPTSHLASGAATEARTPVSPKPKGPSSFKARQPLSQVIPAGTRSSGHTTDSSSGVRVTQKNGAPVAHGGISADGSSRQTARRSWSTERRSVAYGAVCAVLPTRGYSTLPAGRVRARQTSAMRLATSSAAALSWEMASTVSWPAMVPTIFRPFTLSRTLETAPAVPSRVWMTTRFWAGAMPRTKLGRTSMPAAPGSCGSARERWPTLSTPSSARSRLTVACATSIPSSARAAAKSCWVPISFSEMSLRMRSCLVALSTGARVAPKTLCLLLEVLEPEVLRVPERQVHVLHRRSRGALEQVVHRREEQELACPPVHRRREPRPIRVRHVRDVRRLGTRLDEAPSLVVLRVPVENVSGAGQPPAELHDDGLELAPAYRQEVRHEGDLGRLPHPTEHDLYLRRVPVARRAAHDPVRRDALVGRHEMGLDARPGPRSAHPGERVYGDGAHHPPHPAHHRREREYGRCGITPGVCYQPPAGSPEDLRQPVVCLPEQLRSGVLP